MAIFNFLQKDIAIDLGTMNTLCYVDGKGITINESSMVAIDVNTGRIIAVGEEAFILFGKTPQNITIMKPLEEGVIRDYEITQTMLRYFLDKSRNGVSLLQPRALVTIPASITDVEKRAVEDAALQAGARDIVLVPETLATAVGMGLDAFSAKGSLVLNLGAGTCECSVVSLGGVVSSKSIGFGSEKINSIINQEIKDFYSLQISFEEEERIKKEIISIEEYKENVSFDVSGRDKVTYLPTIKQVDSSILNAKIREAFLVVVDLVRDVLERTPPSLSNDILDNGIYISGGLSRIDGLKPFLSKYLNYRLNFDENPETSTAEGIGQLLKRYNSLKERKKRTR